MFELWARKKPINGYGNYFEFICPFDDYGYRFTAIDLLDRDIFQEAVVIDDNYRCVMYIEFGKVLKRKRNK